MRYTVSIAEQTIELDVDPRAEGGYLVRGPEGHQWIVESLGGGPGLLSLLVDGQAITVLPSEGEIRLRGQRYAVQIEDWHRTARAKPDLGALARTISASMPGRIVRVLCEVGARVEATTPLVVISRSSGGYEDTAEVSAALLETERKQQQAELTHLSRNSRQVIAEHSGHNIHLEDPALVVREIRVVVEAASHGGKLVAGQN